MTSSNREADAGVVALERLLARAVDPVVGLIKRVCELTTKPGEPDLFVTIAEFQDPNAFVPRARRGERKLWGVGAHVTRLGALWGAVGEAIERYASGVYFEDDVLTAPFVDVATRALDPREMITFSDEQYDSEGFQFARFDPQAPRGWVAGVDLTNKRDILVPASTALLGYANRTLAEHLDAQYSTGLSAGSSYASAALHAIFEVIERDAFTCHWYTRTPPKRVDHDWLKAALDPKVAALLSHRGLILDVMDITTDVGIPSMLAMLRREHAPGVAIGASCRLEARNAAEKAIIEAFHCMSWITDLERSGTGAVDLDQVKTFEDHTRYYMRPERFSNLEFLISGPVTSALAPGPVPAGSAEAELQGVCEVLHASGCRVILVDVTPDDVRELDLVVVRAIVPGLHPLSCGPGREHFDRRRLKQFSTKRGVELPNVLNPNLHPFP